MLALVFMIVGSIFFWIVGSIFFLPSPTSTPTDQIANEQGI